MQKNLINKSYMYSVELRDVLYIWAVELYHTIYQLYQDKKLRTAVKHSTTFALLLPESKTLHVRVTRFSFVIIDQSLDNLLLWNRRIHTW